MKETNPTLYAAKNIHPVVLQLGVDTAKAWIMV